MRIFWFVFFLFAGLFISCSSDDNNNSGNNYNFYGNAYQNVPSANEVVMYEVNERVFASAKSLNAVTARLDKIKALGVNVLWLMPIYEQGKEKAIGSPYCVKNYKNLEPEYGTLDDLRNLVKQAHNKGMAVIMDWVANHTSWDNAWISNKPWYTQDASGNIISPEGTNWADVADLNYSNTEMRKAMIDAMKYWIVEANIDGYRCDAADWVPADFWSQAISELRGMQSGRTIFMLAEGTNTQNFSAGFDMDYAWNFCDALVELYNGGKTVANLYTVNTSENSSLPVGKVKLRHTTNHDRASENSPVTLFKGQQGAVSAFVIACTMGGSPLIYSTQEIGYSNKLSFFTPTSINWGINPGIYSQYEKIMQVYASSPALQKGAVQTYNNTDIVNFYRLEGNNGVYVAVNVRNEVKTLSVPGQFAGTNMKNLIDGTTMVVPSTIEMEPYQYLILEK